MRTNIRLNLIRPTSIGYLCSLAFSLQVLNCSRHNWVIGYTKKREEKTEILTQIRAVFGLANLSLLDWIYLLKLKPSLVKNFSCFLPSWNQFGPKPVPFRPNIFLLLIRNVPDVTSSTETI